MGVAVLAGLVGLAGLVMWQSSGDSDDTGTSDAEGAAGTAPPPTSVPAPTAPPTTTDASPVDDTFVYFAEGNMSDALAEDLDDGALADVRGTIPGAAASDDFLGRLDEQDPDLLFPTFGPETYDAVVLLALAAESADTDQADEVARHINSVTNGSVDCFSFEVCKDHLEDGDTIRYEGQSGALAFARPGERTVAEFAIFGWNDDNTVDSHDPELRSVEQNPDAPSAGTSPELSALSEDGDADPECSAEPSDGVLSIGGLFVESGDLGDLLGAAQIASAELAVDDINAAGGVLGNDVVYTQTDGAEPDVATAAVEDHIEDGADAVLGPSASDVTVQVIDTVVDSCTVMMGSSVTSPYLTTYDDDGLYFRTSPSDVLQGQMLADLAVDDGAETMVIMARDDDYGAMMTEAAQARFEAEGGTVLETIIYDPDAVNFETEVDTVVSADPDAFLLISFNEGGLIMADAFDAGLTIGS